jgi:hypothetical protein
MEIIIGYTLLPAPVVLMQIVLLTGRISQARVKRTPGKVLNPFPGSPDLRGGFTLPRDSMGGGYARCSFPRLGICLPYGSLVDWGSPGVASVGMFLFVPSRGTRLPLGTLSHRLGGGGCPTVGNPFPVPARHSGH